MQKLLEKCIAYYRKDITDKCPTESTGKYGEAMDFWSNHAEVSTALFLKQNVNH